MNSELLVITVSAQVVRFIALVQRISNCDEIYNQNTNLAHKKTINLLIYGSLRASMISGQVGRSVTYEWFIVIFDAV